MRLLDEVVDGLSYSSKVAATTEEREVRCALKELPEAVKQEGEKIVIEQGKLDEEPGTYTRVRRETPGGCTFTKKVFKDFSEDNITISEQLFEKLFKTVSFSNQTKTRYKWKGWDIDVMEDGKVVAEYELPSGSNSVKIPLIFQVEEALPPTVIKNV
jgi:hypothetical protein